MSENSGKRESGTTRRVAETALDIAVGGGALAADKAVETVEKLVDRAESAIDKGRRETRKSADSLARTAREAVEDADHRPYEERTRDELYALAAEREIEGRSAMRKDELILALRAER